MCTQKSILTLDTSIRFVGRRGQNFEEIF